MHHIFQGITNRIAFPYIRFSSKQQELGDSVKRQMETAENWCRNNNVELSSLSFEDLGVSAFKEGGKRPALADMVDCIKRGVIPKGSYILLENSDRLSRRGFKVALDLVHELVNLDVYIVTLSNGQIFDKNSTTELSSMLPLLLDADRGRAKSERKSNLIKAAKKSLRESRTVKGKLPFWIDAKNGEAVLNEHVSTIEKIIELKLQGQSAQRIARYLNDESNGVQHPNGKKWAAISITATIKNKLLYGCKEYMSLIDGKSVPVEQVENWCPPVCSKREWEAIQPVKRSNGTISRIGPFTGLLRCPSCGGSLQHRKQYYNDTVYLYRRCLFSIEGRCSNKTSFKEPDAVLKQALRSLKVIDLKSSDKNDDADRLMALENKYELLNASKEYVKSPVALGNLYNDLSILGDEIHALKDMMTLSNAQNRRVNFIDLFELSDSEANVELKKIIKKIEFIKLESGVDRVKILYHNGLLHQFIVRHKRGGNTTTSKWQIVFNSDSTKIKTYDASSELYEWEQE